MNINTSRKFFSLLTLCLIGFVIFIFYSEQGVREKQQADIVKSADIIAEAVWTLFMPAADVYLGQINKDQRYKRISIVSSTGTNVFSTETELAGSVDKFLHSLRLIRVNELATPIFYEEKVIGELTVQAYNFSVYVYGYLLVVLTFVLLSLWFAIQLYQAKENLEQRVLERTASLTDLNEKYLAEIDERIRAEGEIRKFKIISDKANYGCAIINMDGTLEYINDYFAKIYRCPGEELLGQNISIFRSKKDNDITIDFFLKDRNNFSLLETWLKTQDGEAVPVLLSGIILNDKQGMPQYMAVSVVDISERKKIELELQHAQKMEAIGTLAGGIAHDFNNILSAILGYSELVKQDLPEDSHSRDDIDQVIKSSNRAADLVKQILTFSRKASPQLQQLMPHLIVKEALQMLSSSLPTTLSIDQRIDSDCGLILADPTNVYQVVMNLCTNAFHAMENEKGTLAVSLCRKDIHAEDIRENDVSPGPFVVLSVSDTGSGMDEETIARIFEPYFTTKEVGKGTGLGLAVIHGIVKDYKGFIQVESELGKGTTFHVYIPATEEVKVVDTPAKTEQEELPRGTERILVVDDESLIIDLNTSILERLGYTVTATTSSVEALEKIRTHADDFDLVITDQTMPNLSGVEMAQEIMRIKPDMPIILCSGYSAVISEEGALASGIKKYLTKPVDMTTLAQIVREVLDEK